MEHELTIELIERWLKDDDWRVRAAAMTALQGRTDAPFELIERGLKDDDCDVRAAAMTALQGRTDAPFELIERWLKDDDCDVRAAAMTALQGRTDAPFELIERGLKDDDCDVRVAAMTALQGRTDAPFELIERGLKDDSWRVRAAAMTACQANGITLPITRSFEPPEIVYKKCVCGVIVCAHIPPDAHIRGEVGMKCRASKATIIDVIGDVGGVNVGISKHDLKTLYFRDDEVEINDFDYGDEECSRGYHFFCTEAEARAY